MWVHSAVTRKMDSKFTLALVVLLHHSAPCLSKQEEFIIPNPAEINDFYEDSSDINNRRDVAPIGPFNPTAILGETVKEIEDLIKTNPKLPRLTRGEIIDILENITSIDILEAQNLTRADGQRAIMVVMPFTAGSAKGDIKELYTRAPVTHMIGEISNAEVKPKKNQNRRKPPSFPKIQIDENDDESNLKRQKGNGIDTFNSPPAITENTIFGTTTERTLSSRVGTPTNPVTVMTHKRVFQNPPEAVGHQQNHLQNYGNHRYPDDDLTTLTPVNDIPSALVNYNDEYSKPFTDFDQDLKRKPFPLEYFQQKLIQSTTMTTTILPNNFKSPNADDIETLGKPDFNKTTMALPKHTTEAIISMHRPSTTIKSIPGVSEVADHLSPDMKDLLQNFGLLENPNVKPNEELPEDTHVFIKNAEIKPESYFSFKPLPDDAPLEQDMDEFLAKFGLGKYSARSQKSIAVNKPAKEFEKNPHIIVDVVPPSYHGLMQDLGFTTKNIKTMQSDNLITSSPKHVYNPTVKNNTEEERLTKLLNIIRALDKRNSNFTDETLRNMDANVLKDLITSFHAQTFVPLNEKEGPNPLNYGYKLLKNEFKRRENSTAPDNVATTEKANGPLFEELEASFGGLPETSTTTTEVPSTTRKSGFYYLVDWNTFLDVDDQNGRRVNLRFQPKVGDPRNFRYVTVP